MAISPLSLIPGESSLIRRGPSYRLACRLGLVSTTGSRRLVKLFLFILITWVPLVILALIRGEAWGRSLVRVPLLEDPVVYSRFLFAIPLLELATTMVDATLCRQTHQFLAGGLVPKNERDPFLAAQARVLCWRDSILSEVLILVLAILLPLLLQFGLGLMAREISWSRDGQGITPAGWWYLLVSLPILFFILLRWVWIYILWAYFLGQVAWLKLELTPTHPDHAGGLGFLGWGLAGFAPVVSAISAVISGGIAYEILHRESSLNSLKYHVLISVLIGLALLYAPLLVFARHLRRCRVTGLYEFSTLVLAHDRAFDERWVQEGGGDPAQLLEKRDASSVAAMGAVFEHIQEMQMVPFDSKAFKLLIVAALVPLVPLVWAALPMTEILTKLMRLLV